MKPLLVTLLAFAVCTAAADNHAVAARLANMARKARASGQTVRAYLLFAEATVRDPQNPTYRANRDALAPAAKLLTKADIQNADIAADIQSAQNEVPHAPPPIERITKADWQNETQLAPPPHVQADPAPHDLKFHSTAKSLLEQVASAFGVRAIVDSDVESNRSIDFEMQSADFRAALEAVTAATHTFVFSVSSNTIYFAPDTEIKRASLEPIIVLTFALPEALTEKDLIDAANAVRGLLSLRTVGWDSFSRTVVIRDRATRARVGRALMETLLLPRAQVSFDVQFLAVDTDSKYHYGATLQTLYQFIDFGHLTGGLKNVLPTAAINSTKFLTFGGGASLFGVGVADAMAFATYSNSVSKALFDATVVVGDRETANFHIGDKYPIASSIYTGFQQAAGSIYNPAPQITLEDLGLVLKITPHLDGDGAVDLEIEAEFKALGNETFNTVPSISQRSFKGRVSLRQGEWAVLAGIDSTTHSINRNGLAGLKNVPGINQVLAENTRDNQTSNTLLVIKPTITRLPMSDVISPQFLVGARRGERVVI